MSNIRFGIRASREHELDGDVTFPLWGFEPTSIDELVAMLRRQQRFWGTISEVGTVSLYLVDPEQCDHDAWRFSARDDYHDEECVVCGQEWTETEPIRKGFRPSPKPAGIGLGS